MMSPHTLESDRLFLRPTVVEDAEFIYRLMNTPKWKKYIGDRKIHTIKDARSYIEDKMMPQLRKLGFGNFTVIRKSDGEKIGSCGMYDRPGLEHFDIGFAFLPEFEQNGYAFESASKILSFARDQLNFDHLLAITSKENKASQNLLVKLGLHYEGFITLPNDDEELLLYSINFQNNI